jgi:metal-responsive CopG/Arc/MetJ family transcriptional regulator
MPKPLKFPTKVLIGLNDDQLRKIDGWRREQNDLPSRSEAIRRLVEHGIKATTPLRARVTIEKSSGRR